MKIKFKLNQITATWVPGINKNEGPFWDGWLGHHYEAVRDIETILCLYKHLIEQAQ